MTARGRVYLDHAAGSPLRPQARAAMVAALEICGNPSSVHASGRAARDGVETARGQVAALAGVGRDGVVFTSGGTEANALGVIGGARARSVRRLIVGATEHDAVTASAAATGLPVEIWPVSAQGVADLDWLKDRLARWSAADGAPFAALMLANNETGVIQPVAEAAALLRDAGGDLHVDAVAAAGKIALDLNALGVASLAVSAHKLGGPQGAGALFLRPGAPLHPVQPGGGQERGLRAGTENVAALAGFGAAATAAMAESAVSPSRGAWRDAAAERLAGSGARVAGEGAARLPNILAVAVEGWASHLQVMALDLEGVMVSAGAACSSGKVKPSPVLGAMGWGSLAAGALRASGGWSSTEADWRRFADVWIHLYDRRSARTRAAVAA